MGRRMIEDDRAGRNPMESTLLALYLLESASDIMDMNTTFNFPTNRVIFFTEQGAVEKVESDGVDEEHGDEY